jgi:hypothetical protein
LLAPGAMDPSMSGKPRAPTCASSTVRRTPCMLMRSYPLVTVVSSATTR